MRHKSTSESGLSDTQVMKMLDQRRVAGTPAHADEQRFNHVPMLRPEDTGTRQALREAVEHGDPVSFAVQLMWSPQQIDLANTPRDPIFRSYTVYTTRVRHDGREWFELRLGFFADVISAKQVAHYMHSEYNSAAVVPVSAQEESAARAAASAAKGADNRAAAGASAATGASQPAAAGVSKFAAPGESRAPAPSASKRPRLRLVHRASGKSA